MREAVYLVGAGLAGIFLGAMFFGGLWWSTRKGIASDQPAFWFVGSLLCRTSLMLVGLYWVGAGDWRRILACLLGFVIARMAFLRLSYSPPRLPSLQPALGGGASGGVGSGFGGGL